MEKQCSTCGETKDFSEYNRQRSAKDGVRSQCKGCLAAYRKKNAARIAAWGAEYRKTRRAEAIEYAREWREKFPEKSHAICKRWRDANSDYIKGKKRDLYESHGEDLRARARQYYAENTEQCKARNKEWRMQDPEKVKRISRNSSLKHLYGITTSDYNRMMLEQQGCCAMCGESLEKRNRNYPVDHDHSKTGPGSVRGIVHDQCNAIIAIVENEPERLLQAGEYLHRATRLHVKVE